MPQALSDLKDFAALLGRRFVETRCPQVAGSLAFTTLLSLVPLLTVAIVMFGRFSGFSSLGSALQSFLLTNLLPEKAGNIIATYALQFSEKAANLTLLGIVMLVVSALMLLLTIEGVFNQIWGIRKPRSLWTRVTMYWMALTIGPVALGVCALATSEFLKLSLGMAPKVLWLRETALQLTSFLLLGLLFSLTYLVVPNRPVKLKHALSGGILAGALFLGMQRVFGQFVAGLPTYTLVYGTFAALPIFLAWLYSSWLVVLLGALVTATLPGFANRRQGGSEHYPGREVLIALHILRVLHNAHQEGSSRTTTLLCREACCSHEEAELLLQRMRDQQWISRDDNGAWLLARPAESVALADVINTLALSSSGPLHSGSHPLGQSLSEVLARSEQELRIPVTRLFSPDAPSQSE